MMRFLSFKALAWTGACAFFLASCYSYGPVHTPYGGKIAPLPPPPPRVTAAPLTKTEYLRKAYTELKTMLPEAEVLLIEDSIKVYFPNNITYQTREILPSSDYAPPLHRFAGLLKKYTQTDILALGHTDNRGKEANNRALSQVRANQICRLLADDGVRAGRLHAWGLGSTVSIDDNVTEEGRARNRRVEFVVLFREK